MSGQRPSQRRRAERRGRLAELRAAVHLLLRGYRLVARRIRTPVGEIDLVARRGDQIIVIEVKARRDIDQGLAALTPVQRRRIEQAALLVAKRLDPAGRRRWRFDLIAVAPRPGALRHVKDAWRPG